jgi:hypothetical protein
MQLINKFILITTIFYVALPSEFFCYKYVIKIKAILYVYTDIITIV